VRRLNSEGQKNAGPQILLRPNDTTVVYYFGVNKLNRKMAQEFVLLYCSEVRGIVSFEELKFHSFHEYTNWNHYVKKIKQWHSELEGEKEVLSAVKLKFDKQNWLKEALEFAKYFGHGYFPLDLRRLVNLMEADLDVPRDDTVWEEDTTFLSDIDINNVPERYNEIIDYAGVLPHGV